jgi:iron complex outermembrane receptor protein
VALYQIIQNNVLVSANDQSNPDLLRQRGQERARGIEMEVSGRINKEWSINGAFAYNKAIITKDAEGDPNKIVGRIKENAPLSTSNIWLKYEGKSGYLNGLGFAVGFSQVSERNTFDTQLQLPGYAILNAAVFYNIDKFRLSLNLNNLTNKTHWTGGYNFQRNYPGAPRNMLLTVGYDF